MSRFISVILFAVVILFSSFQMVQAAGPQNEVQRRAFEIAENYDQSVLLMDKIVSHLKKNRVWAAPISHYPSGVWEELCYRVKEFDGKYNMDMDSEKRLIIIRKN